MSRKRRAMEEVHILDVLFTYPLPNGIDIVRDLAFSGPDDRLHDKVHVYHSDDWGRQRVATLTVSSQTERDLWFSISIDTQSRAWARIRPLMSLYDGLTLESGECVFRTDQIERFVSAARGLMKKISPSSSVTNANDDLTNMLSRLSLIVNDGRPRAMARFNSSIGRAVASAPYDTKPPPLATQAAAFVPRASRQNAMRSESLEYDLYN